MESERPDTSNLQSRIILDVMISHGVRTIILSPGSRNAPLLIASSAREELKKYIIHDERTAGFVALGIAMVTREPVLLACTSGTALYNYAPAVAEAYYQKVPLIVITADRPAQWIDQDDSQTLRQPGALANIVRRSYDISGEIGMTTRCGNCEFSNEHEWYVNRIANEAYHVATSGQRGPVHINIQLGNRLNETVARSEQPVRTVRYVGSDRRLSYEQTVELAERFRNSRVLIVCGFGNPSSRLNRALVRAGRLPNVSIMAETISNMHLDEGAYMIDSLLCAMSAEEKRALRPDIIITLGGALVSRMVKEYLRSCDGSEHWTLGDTDISVDSLQRLTLHIDAEPSQSLNGLISKSLKAGSSDRGEAVDRYSDEWDRMRARAKQERTEKLERAPWSELVAFDKILRNIPSETNMMLSNGTPVRYSQILEKKLPHLCCCNRGVSGIDGTSATALGMSLAYGGMTVLITGDMSFAYCPEILHYNRLGGDLRVIVINNGGGGIFRFINTTRSLTVREEYFCADPELPTESVTAAYGWHYLSAENEEELDEALETFKTQRRTLLEVKVDGEKSAEVLRAFLNMGK